MPAPSSPRMTSSRLASPRTLEAREIEPMGAGKVERPHPATSPGYAMSGKAWRRRAGRGGFDLGRASKFPPGTEYFDVNYLWVPGLGRVVGLLCRTPVRPEVMVALSLAAGLASAGFFLEPGYAGLVLGTVFIQLKNYLDTIDGHLARAKGIDSSAGRFLDTLSDFVVYLALFSALGVRLARSGGWTMLVLAYGAMTCAFIQCSYYNFYLVAYLRLVGRTRSRNDERVSGEGAAEEGGLVRFLRRVYLLLFGWQDRVIAWIDRKGRLAIGRGRGDKPGASLADAGNWYTDKRILAANSPLCFGTQILFLSVFSLAGRPSLFLYFLLVPANLYLLLLVWLKPRVARSSGF